MAAAAKKPVVVLVITANPLDISALLINPKVGAVLHLGQPSTTVLGVEARLRTPSHCRIVALRFVALHYRSSTLHQTHEHTPCLSC